EDLPIAIDPADLSAVSAAPAPPNGSATRGLELINATAAWRQYDQRGENATVAVLDTGVDPTAHPSLDPAAWAEFAMNGSRVPSTPHDPHGHGTHTSGTVVGATTPNGTHYGVAPNATLIHGKVATGAGFATYASVIAGMEWALQQQPRPDAISISIGLTSQSLFIEPVQRARATGTVVVAASGNSGPGTAGSPALVYGALSVGAVNETGRVTAFSSGRRVHTRQTWGPYAPDDWPAEYVVPDVVAPGTRVYSAVPGGYARMSGTSMATPHVAGAVALLRSEHPNLSVSGVQRRLTASAEQQYGNGTVDRRAGHGLINLTAALEARSETVRGIVRIDGHPAANVTVEAAGYTTTTNASGAYSLRVPARSVTVTARPFGWERAATTVDPSHRTRVNLSVDDRSPAIALSAGPDLYASPTETITTRVRVASADRLGVVVHGTPVTESASLDLSVAGQSLGPNQTADLPDNTSTVTVTIDPERGYVGEIGLTLVARNGTETANRTVGPLRIHPDPIVVPEHVSTGEIQSAMNLAEAGTTIRFDNEDPLTIPVTANATAGSTLTGPIGNTGFVVPKSLTITASPDAAPLRFINHSDQQTTGISTIANTPGVTIENLTIEGNVSYGIASSASGVTVDNTTVRGVGTGFMHSSLLSLLSGLDAAEPTVTDSQFENVTRGVMALGAMREVSDTTVRSATGGYILLSPGVRVRNVSANASALGMAIQGPVETVRDVDLVVDGATSQSPSSPSVNSSLGLLLATNGTVRNVDVRATGSNATAAIQVVKSNVSMSNVSVRGAGVDLGSVVRASITDLRVHDAVTGLRIGRYNGSSITAVNESRNVSVSRATITATDRAIVIENGSEAVVDTVTATGGSPVVVGEVDPATTVRNLSVGGRARITLGGQNATLRRVAPPSLPDDRRRVSPALRAADRGPNATLDLSVRATGPLGSVERSSLGLARYESGAWNETVSARGRQAVAEDVALPGTYALLGDRVEALNITAVEMPGRARPGERVTATVTVENVIDSSATEQVRYTVGGVTHNTTRATLAPGETRSVDVSWTVPPTAAVGNRTQRIAVGESTRTATLTVEPPTGRLTGRVLGDRDGQPVANATVVVDGPRAHNVSTNATGAFVVDGLVSGHAYTLTVEKRGYTATSKTVTGDANATVTLRQRARYLGLSSVTISSAEESVVATATVTNLGRENWTAPVELTVDGVVVATQSITLAPGQHRDVRMERGARAGEWTVALASPNESVAASVTVESDTSSGDGTSDDGSISIGNGFDIETQTPTDEVRTPVQTTTTTETATTTVETTTTTATTT
ncbi:MAG: S8 family serine peptidase, partial [Halococcoides sp.]